MPEASGFSARRCVTARSSTTTWHRRTPSRSGSRTCSSRGATGSTREDEARFGYAVGPHSWKQFLFPPRVRLAARAQERVTPDRATRGCRGAAGVLRDALVRAARDGDPGSRLSRRRLCRAGLRRAARPSLSRSTASRPETCSTSTPTKVEAGYDLALTEILDGEHRFLVEVGSKRGEEVLGTLSHREASVVDLTAASASIAPSA